MYAIHVAYEAWNYQTPEQLPQTFGWMRKMIAKSKM